MRHHRLAIAATTLGLTAACTSASPVDAPRNAIAIEDGDSLTLFIADGPQACESPRVQIVVGPGCDSPSWQLVVPLAIDAAVGQPIDLFAPVEQPQRGIEFSMQGAECHSGEPAIDSGTVTLGPREGAAMDVTLSVSAQSSFDPSGLYRAQLCD